MGSNGGAFSHERGTPVPGFGVPGISASPSRAAQGSEIDGPRSGFRVPSFGRWVSDFECRVSGFVEFPVSGPGSRVSGFGFRDPGPGSGIQVPGHEPVAGSCSRGRSDGLQGTVRREKSANVNSLNHQREMTLGAPFQGFSNWHLRRPLPGLWRVPVAARPIVIP